MMHKHVNNNTNKRQISQADWKDAIAAAEKKKLAALIRADELESAISIFKRRMESGEPCPERLTA